MRRVGARTLMPARRNYSIQTVGVMGMGLMGHGIVQTSAAAGYNVVAFDSNSAAVDKGMAMIDKSVSRVLTKKVEKGMDAAAADAEKSGLLGRIQRTSNIKDLAQCDMVVEAIIEDIDIKRKVYADLGSWMPEQALLASNTSSFKIAELSKAANRPETVFGLHFFNPVQMMKLVEIVATPTTSDAVMDAGAEYVKRLGKVGVRCKDTPGFIVNRLLVPYMSEAMAMIDRGDASAKDIDTAMKLGAGYPMGPLQLSDYVGLDTTLSILQGWVKDYPNDGFHVPECLKGKVADGALGRKSGAGFFEWDGDKMKQ